MYLLLRVDGKQTIPTVYPFKCGSNQKACEHAKEYMAYWTGEIELIHRNREGRWELVRSWTKPNRDEFYEFEVRE
jgi:hypothetical protein